MLGQARLGFSDPWSFRSFDFWTFDLLVFWFLDIWPFGLLIFGHFTFLSFDFWKFHLLVFWFSDTWLSVNSSSVYWNLVYTYILTPLVHKYNRKEIKNNLFLLDNFWTPIILRKYIQTFQHTVFRKAWQISWKKFEFYRHFNLTVIMKKSENKINRTSKISWLKREIIFV